MELKRIKVDMYHITTVLCLCNMYSVYTEHRSVAMCNHAIKLSLPNTYFFHLIQYLWLLNALMHTYKYQQIVHTTKHINFFVYLYSNAFVLRCHCNTNWHFKLYLYRVFICTFTHITTAKTIWNFVISANT